jgi:hypothetical protein
LSATSVLENVNQRMLGTVAVVLGLLVAANPAYLGLWTDAGHLRAIPVSSNAVDAAEDPTVIEYESLSRHARLVVDRAIADGYYPVLGPSNRPDEFVYPGGLDSRPGSYFVERGGNYYHLRTSGEVFGGVYLVVQFALVALGGLVAYSGRSARRGVRHPGVPLVGGGVAVVLTAFGPPLGYPLLSLMRWSFLVLGVVGAVVLAALVRKAYAVTTN